MGALMFKQCHLEDTYVTYCLNAGKRERDKGMKGINERKKKERRMTIGRK
jgi:hypothetical protein